MQFLLEEGGTDLMHGDGRCEGSEHQQGIEQDGDEVTHCGHRNKRLLEHIRQSNENERGAAVRLNADGEGGREDHQSGEDSDG